MFRKAETKDIEAIAAIYELIHNEEEAGRMTTGWIRGVYPTRDTAAAAVAKDEMYVLEEDGHILAAAKINREQDPAYAHASWQTDAPENKIMVLHTLVVSPAEKGRGLGRAFVAFYEQIALESGCPYLRMDTNERNLAARALYRKLGYTEVGAVPCQFNGIEGVNLVCLEKTL